MLLIAGPLAAVLVVYRAAAAIPRAAIGLRPSTAARRRIGSADVAGRGAEPGSLGRALRSAAPAPVMTGNATPQDRSPFLAVHGPLARRIAGLAVLGTAIAVGLSAGLTVPRNWDWAVTAGATAAIPLGVFVGGWNRRGRATAFSLPLSGGSIVLGIAVLVLAALLARNVIRRWRAACRPSMPGAGESLRCGTCGSRRRSPRSCCNWPPAH